MKETTENRPVIDLFVQGMSCGHCVRAVKGALMRVPGAVDAEVDLETGHARLWHSGPGTLESAQAEIAEEGFTATER